MGSAEASLTACCIGCETVDAQAVLALHRVRDGFIRSRTAQANQLRGLLAEFGLAIAQGMGKLIVEVKHIIADMDSGLPPLMRNLAQCLLSHLLEADRQVQQIDLQVRQLCRQSEVCRRRERVPGIDPLTASAREATVADNIAAFKNGRQMAASLAWCPNSTPEAVSSDCKPSVSVGMATCAGYWSMVP